MGTSHIQISVCRFSARGVSRFGDRDMTENTTADVLESLVDRIDALEQRVKILEQRLETNNPVGTSKKTIKGRIENLEEQTDTDESADGTLDQYDATVIDAVAPGETYSLEELQSLYRSAGIVQSQTIKQRVKRITTMPYFERVDSQLWQFTGRDS